MNRKNTQRLLRKFPFLYRGYYKPMRETCMCWGFECGDGWFDILWTLSGLLDRQIKIGKFRRALDAVALSFTKVWNSIIYRLSPPGSHDFMARLAGRLTPSGDVVKDAKRALGLKRLVLFPYPLFEVVQVKEKYGTLQFYCRGRLGKGASPEGIQLLIQAAESASETTCEICGSSGKLYEDDCWMHVACKLCREKESQ